jgi:hypothetical protein
MIFFRNYLLTTFVKLGPPRFRRFLVDLLPFKNARRLRDIIDIIHNTSVEILEAKRRALKEGDEVVARQIGRGKDIISILSVCLQYSAIYSLTKYPLSESKHGSINGR